jgi:hypothetical protein
MVAQRVFGPKVVHRRRHLGFYSARLEEILCHSEHRLWWFTVGTKQSTPEETTGIQKEFHLMEMGFTHCSILDQDHMKATNSSVVGALRFE